jgi:hypothetical protein
MTAALRRVLSAPGWVATLWVLFVGFAATAGGIVAATVDGALRPHGTAPDGRLAYALADLVLDHGAIAGAAAAAVVTAAALGLLAWTLLAGAVIARLSDGRPSTEALATGWRTLPAVLVQTAWHVVLRAVVVLAALSTASALPPAAGWPVLWVVWALCTVGLDLARVRVVTGGEAPFHPRTAALALVDVVRGAGRWWPAMILAAISALLPATIVWLGASNLGANAMPTFARAMSLVALLVGLWRIALVAMRAPPSAADT